MTSMLVKTLQSLNTFAEHQACSCLTTRQFA